jgi:hypothetical protein
VTIESVKTMQINELLDSIEDYEIAISEGDLNISTVQTLNTLYQKAIEYYSAIGQDEQSAEILTKMKEILQRPDIQVVMNSALDQDKYKLK